MPFARHKGTALITGASLGIGAVYAKRLARAGYDLILVARQADRLRTFATLLTNESGRSVEMIAADLSNPADLVTVVNTLAMDASVTFLVNNAGIGSFAPGTRLLDAHEAEQSIALSVIATIRLAYAVAPGFAARGRGTIVNISSMAAIAPEYVGGVHGANGAFVLALTRSLHHQFSRDGVRVQVVLPPVPTARLQGPLGKSNGQGQRNIDIEYLVDAALSSLDQGELVTMPYLPDTTLWTSYEHARDAIATRLSCVTPARRRRPR
ncbi:SDR family NAD(P)-dependent oxidoreductase [Nguyenibacter vanlangensis]|uniref:SDR family NAD(P)-dependent oxidoreductase n=1 Tax=Nguyenibacter vanlangensis TaxID=1216886 RepID=A0A7Y7IT30_9PROT|nr:SDR family NAD(P)-dependent oxidoreductase [Nguyenibacter vanlangensis]NVN09642.1 SDR family NAD(P)-dependent oxidoreductase [Nguyenibacter vanlangensis]